MFQNKSYKLFIDDLLSFFMKHFSPRLTLDAYFSTVDLAQSSPFLTYAPQPFILV